MSEFSGAAGSNADRVYGGRFIERVDNAVENVCVGLGIIQAGAALLACGSLIITGDPLAMPKDLIGKFESCSPVNPDLVAKYKAAITPGPGNKPKVVTGAFDTSDHRDVMTERRANAFKVHLANDSEETARNVLSLSPQAGLLEASEFTQAEYGFRIKSVDPDSVRSQNDAAKLIRVMHGIPQELVRNITKDDLQEVVLGDLTLSEDTNANYNFKSKQIRMKPKTMGDIGHELIGHALATADSRQHCIMPNSRKLPATEDANPAHFTYTGSNWRIATRWQGITFTQYGSSAVEEDFADGAAAITNTSGMFTNYKFQQTDTIREKTAINLATMGEVDPPSADFYADIILDKSLS